MQYGDWELRNDSAYYPSQDVMLYPSSNSSDNGSLHIESNVRSIVRRLTRKSYKLRNSDFTVSWNADRTKVTVAPGEGNIQGYHLIVDTTASLPVPHTVWTTPLTLGISLSYDASNNVTGDVIAYDKPQGQNELFSGAYLFFYDDCQVRQNYDNILVLGRAWVKGGAIVPDGTNIDVSTEPDNPYVGYHIEKGFEVDPVNDHVMPASSIEVKVQGVPLTSYDTLQSVVDDANNTLVLNISDVHRYDSAMYEVEQDPTKYSKPPTFTTDIQDYVRYMPDWYTNKYGDYMTGALRFDQLSIDGKIQLDPDHAQYYTKDSSNPLWSQDPDTFGRYHGTEGVFISPRPLGKLSRRDHLDWDSGGTLMSVVPYSYTNGLDYNNGDTAIYAALTSTRNNDTGLKLHSADGGRSKLVHINGTNTLLLENRTESQSANEISSIQMHEGEVFIDSFNSKGIQLYSGSTRSSVGNVAFRFDDYKARMISHSNTDHRHTATGTMRGVASDTTHIEYGVGIPYEPSNPEYATSGMRTSITDPYLQVGNLRVRSNYSASLIPEADPSEAVMIPTIEVANPGALYRDLSGAAVDNIPFNYYKPKSSNSVPYVSLLPGIYAPNALIPDYIQIGSTSEHDVVGDHAITQTANRIIMYKHGRQDEDQQIGFTAIEQNFSPNTSSSAENTSQIFNKLTPFTSEPTETNYSRNYVEIGGIYSYGNIGASTATLDPYTGRDRETGPYQADEEWVRFTRYRYNRDQDVQNGGKNNNANHNRTYGDTYNIEFNTNVANIRSNQIIWNYKGSQNHQPLTLSYIHDEITEYPNDTYYDHNMYKHRNPTFGVRDFLRIDGGGLSIHGDINNPTLAGDVKNDPERFGMTLLQGRVYSGVYNDYAETYEKADADEISVEGMVVMLDTETGKYKICDEAQSPLVVGVISDNYGMLIGGKCIESAEDHLESVMQKHNFAVGVSGKVFVNVAYNNIEPGDLLVSAKISGLAEAVKDKSSIVPGTVIGKALSKAEPVEGETYYRCLMQIMLS